MPVCMLTLQSRLTLCNSLDCSPPGSSVRGILQARILEWAAMLSSRGSSRPRDGTRISHISAYDQRRRGSGSLPSLSCPLAASVREGNPLKNGAKGASRLCLSVSPLFFKTLFKKLEFSCFTVLLVTSVSLF